MQKTARSAELNNAEMIPLMMRIMILALLVLSSQCTPAGAQFGVDQLSSTMSDENVLDAFAVGHIAFVYRETQLPAPEKAISDLGKIIPVDRAVEHGSLFEETRELVDQLLGLPHETRLKEAAAVNHGDSGFIWKMTWELFPDPGGFSGVPYQYRSYVNPDGSLLLPEKFLIDEFPLFPLLSSFESDPTLFSVLAFEDLEANKPILHGDKILELATTALKHAIEQSKFQGKMEFFRFHDQSLWQLPVDTDHTSKIVTHKVWKVNFIPADTPEVEIHDVDPMTVWVTEDGRTSELTFDRWEAKARRSHP